MRKYFLLLVSLIFLSIAKSQNVGIGTNTPDSSAKLEIASSSQGFLPPRLTYVQRNAMQHPAAGLMIWCIECAELQVFNGLQWTNMTGGTACADYIPGIVICNQVWMTKNLDVSKYRNGDIIPQVTSPTAWNALLTGAWCWYNNDSATYADTYGKIYNWYAVNDSRGLAPLGWHIGSTTEWSTLGACVGGDTTAAFALKEAGLLHWRTNNINTTNSSGFTALPGGYRFFDGTFTAVLDLAFWWTASPSALPTNSYMRSMTGPSGLLGTSNGNLRLGAYVRCVRD
jgi:uncharacterized protein (TIGR02145 family)